MQLDTWKHRFPHYQGTHISRSVETFELGFSQSNTPRRRTGRHARTHGLPMWRNPQRTPDARRSPQRGALRLARSGGVDQCGNVM